MMILYDDPRWTDLRGGYRDAYDPRPALRKLEANGGSDEVWEELWQELHHQGDVDLASYAAVTVLAGIEGRRRDLGWNAYAIVSIIESERHRTTNPDVPEWLRPAYADALRKMRECAIAQLETSSDQLLIRSALAVVALSSGLCAHGLLLVSYEDAEIRDIVGQEFAWQEQCADKGKVE